MNTLLLADDVKRLTSAGPNADEVKLNKAVPDAQVSYLRPLLGSALFAQLLAFVSTAPEPPSLANLSPQAQASLLAAYATELQTWRTANADPLLTLWEQVKPCLAQWTLVEAWPDLLVHIDAAGVVQKTGNSTTGTTSADVATLNQVSNHHRDKAVRRGTELVSWLEAHKSDYPAYVSTRPAPTNAQPINFFGGIDLS